MEKFLKGVGFSVIVAIVIVIMAALFAYPTKWLVNYLFNPVFLATVFTTGKFTFWHALALNWLSGTLFKSVSTSSKS